MQVPSSSECTGSNFNTSDCPYRRFAFAARASEVKEEITEGFLKDLEADAGGSAIMYGI